MAFCEAILTQIQIPETKPSLTWFIELRSGRFPRWLRRPPQPSSLTPPTRTMRSRSLRLALVLTWWPRSSGWSNGPYWTPQRRARWCETRASVAARRESPAARFDAGEESLAGKRALVTGASGGIGAAIAVSLASRGCRLVLHYNTREEGAKETARRAFEAGGTVDAIVQADFRSSAAVDDVWRHVDAAWYGEIDVLVNNAGAVTKRAANEASFAAWDDTMAINLDAPYRLACGARSRMRSGGVVVMVSSVHGARSVEWMSAYAASKAALDSLTRTLGVEWAREGVRVVGVAPGPVPVERTMARITTPEAQALWRPHLPLGSMGTVDQCADAVLWLVESPASDWITGQTITLDGGLSARINMPVRPRPQDHVTTDDDAPRPTAAILEAPDLYASPRLVSPAVNGHAVAPTLADAREAATVAAATYGPGSPQAADAWAVVDDLESRAERIPVATLADECSVDATTVKCLQLAKDLEELEGLMAKGPDSSPLREATRRMLREIEEQHDNNPFRNRDAK